MASSALLFASRPDFDRVFLAEGSAATVAPRATVGLSLGMSESLAHKTNGLRGICPND